MKINEVINEKERVDEFAPLIPLAIAGGKAIAGAIAGHGARTAATHGAKALTKKFGGPIVNKGRQWLSKAPPDSSTPDALKNKVGYGAGQVDPGLAKAAKHKAVAGAGIDAPPKLKPNSVSAVGGRAGIVNRRATA